MDDISEFFEAGGLPFDRPITFFEIGAHVGMHTRYFLEAFPKADLWVFEPDPRNAAEIRRHGLDKRVRLFELAIADRDGTMKMHLSSGRRKGGPPSTLENWTFSSSLKAPRAHLKKSPWVKFPHTAEVKVARLDTIKKEQGFGDIDFIWCDIQGAEDLMLAGAPETLARTRYLYTEYSDEELYEGQINMHEILRRLPGGPAAWEVVQDFGDDVFVRNRMM